MKKGKTAVIIVIALAIVLAAAGWFLLPDTLVMQISSGGTPGTTMPKPVGLALPLLLTAVFAVLYLRSGEGKNLLLAWVGVALQGLTLVFNLLVF